MKGLTMRFIVLLLLGIAVLVFGLFLLSSQKGIVKSPMYETALRGCCTNWCASHTTGAQCSVPKELDSDGTKDGKMTIEDLAKLSGYVDSSGNADSDKLNSLCGCD